LAAGAACVIDIIGLDAQNAIRYAQNKDLPGTKTASYNSEATGAGSPPMRLQYDLVDLRLFVNVAEARSLTRGAERTFLSVGAASLRIKNLEAALQARLLNRHSQGMHLTPAGEALLSHALSIFREIERLHGDLQNYSHGLKGQVRIFANTTAITEILPNALSRFLASRPDIDIDLEERLSPDIARAVAEGNVDIGILAGNVKTDGLEVIPYQKDRLVIAVPAGHPLENAGVIDFGDALPFNFISLHRDSAIHSFVEQVVASLGTSISVRIRVSSFEALCRMVEANVGIGMLPRSVGRRLAGSHAIALVELSDAWAARELKICVQDMRQLPSFASDLIEYLVADQPRDEQAR